MQILCPRKDTPSLILGKKCHYNNNYLTTGRTFTINQKMIGVGPKAKTMNIYYNTSDVQQHLRETLFFLTDVLKR